MVSIYLASKLIVGPGVAKEMEGICVLVVLLLMSSEGPGQFPHLSVPYGNVWIIMNMYVVNMPLRVLGVPWVCN